MKTLCPYFGNVYKDHFVNDLRDLNSHNVDVVVHPVSENDHAFRSKNIRDLVTWTQDYGLEAWIDPHTVGNIFGFGNLSTLRWQGIVNVDGTEQERTCPADPAFQDYMLDLLKTYEGADGVLWDEPDLSPCYCERCYGTVPMVRFLRESTSYARSLGMINSVCFWGGRIHQETVAIAACMDDVGVSIPPEHNTQENVEKWFAHLKLQDKTTSAWFPGYNVPAGEEGSILNFVRLAGRHTIDSVGSWVYRGCEGWGYAACERPDVVWHYAGLAFREVHLV